MRMLRALFYRARSCLFWTKHNIIQSLMYRPLMTDRHAFLVQALRTGWSCWCSVSPGGSLKVPCPCFWRMFFVLPHPRPLAMALLLFGRLLGVRLFGHGGYCWAKASWVLFVGPPSSLLVFDVRFLSLPTCLLFVREPSSNPGACVFTYGCMLCDVLKYCRSTVQDT